MILKVQILTLIFSFLFGIIFDLEIKLNYKFIYQEKQLYKIITTFFFVMTNVLLYFIILQKINNGILHIYGIIAIIIGFTLSNYVIVFLQEKIEKIVKK